MSLSSKISKKRKVVVEGRQKVKELKDGLRSQKNVCANTTERNDAAVKVSFIVAEEIINMFFRMCIHEAEHAEGT